MIAGKKRILRRTVKADRFDDRLADDLERTIREVKSLARSKLPHGQLTASALTDLEQHLVQRGLEVTEKTVRVPIREQLLDLLQNGGHVRRTGIRELVKGALVAEIGEVIHQLVKAGQVHVVIRTKEEMLVGPEASVLSSGEIVRLAKLAEQLADILNKVHAKGGPRTLLRDDVTVLFDGLQERPTRRVDAPPTSRQVFEAKLRSIEDPTLKLVSIPNLVRSLAGQLSIADIHHALSEAAERGAIELHPDGGNEYLRPEDAALCPPGPRDTVFSRARLLSP